jgi:hypothetical protein
MKEIIIVSGLPRSGTSMMMAMLQAAGLELLVDDIRTADQDNPRGYYEYDKVKRLHKDTSWLHEAQGKVVKIVSSFLEFLPPEHYYRVIFMQRTMTEILSSQQKMLDRNQRQAAADNAKLSSLFNAHIQKVLDYLDKQNNFTTCRLSFNRLLLSNPEEELTRLIRFFDGRLEKDPMLAVIDKALYRQRGPTTDNA